MKKTIILLLTGCFLLVSLNTADAGSARSKWQKAKKSAESILKKAKLGKLKDHVKFDMDLGPKMDTFQKAKQESPLSDKMLGKISGVSNVAEIKKDKSIRKVFDKYMKTQGASFDEWELYQKPKGAKKTYTDYVDKGRLNIDSGVTNKWKPCKDSGFDKKKCKDVYKETLEAVEGNLNDNQISRFKSNIKTQYATMDIKGKKAEVINIISEYLDRVDDMGKGVSDSAKKTEIDKAKIILRDQLRAFVGGGIK